jgi:hypothetical protein
MMEVESQTKTVEPLEPTRPVGSIEIEELRKEVKGKTLQVYLLLARAKEQDFGVREIHQKLKFSSVSLAAYHLNKLEAINLVTKTADSRYKVAKQIALGSYEDFFVLKGKYLPKEAFFVTFSSSSLGLSILFFFFQMWAPMLTLLTANAILGTAFSWKRFLTIYKQKDEEET